MDEPGGKKNEADKIQGLVLLSVLSIHVYANARDATLSDVFSGPSAGWQLLLRFASASLLSLAPLPPAPG